jgi:hypothetical protein
MELYIKIIIIILVIVIIFYILNKIIRKHSNEYFSNDNRLCCLYAYYEKDELYKNNFKYFLENGLLDNVDYYIIINGKYTANIPEKKNIKVYKRENNGYDFGAYSYAISKLEKEYDYYFFMNTSVSGPYLRDNSKQWTRYFLDLFNENVKIVGTTINMQSTDTFDKYDLKSIYNKKNPFSHVQSMFFCIDNEYFNYLKNIDFFNENEINNMADINEIIVKKEIGISQVALNKGWNINCILPYYKDINYTKLKKDINPTSFYGDPYYKDSYFGKTLDKYDVIFFKTNRDLL